MAPIQRNLKIHGPGGSCVVVADSCDITATFDLLWQASVYQYSRGGDGSGWLGQSRIFRWEVSLGGPRKQSSGVVVGDGDPPASVGDTLSMGRVSEAELNALLVRLGADPKTGPWSEH